jgi:hypothetical protein
MSARCSAERCRELAQQLRNRVIFARWLGEQAVGVVRRELVAAWDAGRTVPPRAAAPAVEAVVAPAAAPVGTVTRAAAPFEGYDTLPASHIVDRLRRMTPDELHAARAHEVAHRNRRTVLAKVDQLLHT